MCGLGACTPLGTWYVRIDSPARFLPCRLLSAVLTCFPLPSPFPCPLLAVALCPYAQRPCCSCLRSACCATVCTLDKGRFLPRLVVGKYARAERCHMFRSLYVYIVRRACVCTHACLLLIIVASSISVPPSHVALSQVCEMHLHDCRSHTTQPTDNVRRIAKRVTGYCAILRTPEYYAAYCLWYQGRIASMPPEPDPYDLNVSKRTWEASVQHWRNELRTPQNASPQ